MLDYLGLCNIAVNKLYFISFIVKFNFWVFK
jgi:hypothetical protein